MVGIGYNKLANQLGQVPTTGVVGNELSKAPAQQNFDQFIKGGPLMGIGNSIQGQGQGGGSSHMPAFVPSVGPTGGAGTNMSKLKANLNDKIK